jgi:hypothetical protein
MKKEQYYLLTEDDPEQAKSIQDKLLSEIERGFSIKWIGSEAEAMIFLKDIEQGFVPPPRAWLSDAMMLFSIPGPDSHRPSKAIIKEGIAKAGERLRKQARKIKAMKRVPVVFYSAIRKQTAGFNDTDKIAAFVSKEESLQSVLQKIKELEEKARTLSDDDIDGMPWEESADSVTTGLESETELRRTILEGMRIPWNACKPFRLAKA